MNHAKNVAFRGIVCPRITMTTQDGPIFPMEKAFPNPATAFGHTAEEMKHVSSAESRALFETFALCHLCPHTTPCQNCIGVEQEMELVRCTPSTGQARTPQLGRRDSLPCYGVLYI